MFNYFLFILIQNTSLLLTLSNDSLSTEHFIFKKFSLLRCIINFNYSQWSLENSRIFRNFIFVLVLFCENFLLLVRMFCQLRTCVCSSLRRFRLNFDCFDLCIIPLRSIAIHLFRSHTTCLYTKT